MYPIDFKQYVKTWSFIFYIFINCPDILNAGLKLSLLIKVFFTRTKCAKINICLQTKCEKSQKKANYNCFSWIDIVKTWWQLKWLDCFFFSCRVLGNFAGHLLHVGWVPDYLQSDCHSAVLQGKGALCIADVQHLFTHL